MRTSLVNRLVPPSAVERYAHFCSGLVKDPVKLLSCLMLCILYASYATPVLPDAMHPLCILCNLAAPHSDHSTSPTLRPSLWEDARRSQEPETQMAVSYLWIWVETSDVPWLAGPAGAGEHCLWLIITVTAQTLTVPHSLMHCFQATFKLPSA